MSRRAVCQTVKIRFFLTKIHKMKKFPPVVPYSDIESTLNTIKLF